MFRLFLHVRRHRWSPTYLWLKKVQQVWFYRYSLVVGTAKRAREIRDEAIEREEPIDVKTVSVAIDEILDGKYVIEEPDELKSNKK